MKRIIIGTIAVAFVAAGGWFAYQSGQKTPAETPPTTTRGDGKKVRDQGVGEPSTPIKVSKSYPNDHEYEKGRKSCNDFYKNRRIKVMIDQCRSLDIPQIELLFFQKIGETLVPVAIGSLQLQSAPVPGEEIYRQSVSFGRTVEPQGVRFGVARDSEEEKFPDLLRKGMSYKLIVQTADGTEPTSKLITVPTDMKVGMIYQFSIVLDQSQFSFENKSKEKEELTVSGSFELPRPRQVGWRYKVAYHEPNGQIGGSGLDPKGKFAIAAEEMGGFISILALTKERGYVLALSRAISKQSLTPNDFEWRLNMKEMSKYRWPLTTPVAEIKMIGLKLKTSDPRPVFWTSIPKTSAGVEIPIEMSSIPGKYFVTGLISYDGGHLPLDLGTVSLGNGKASYNALPPEQVERQKEKLEQEAEARKVESEMRDSEKQGKDK